MKKKIHPENYRPVVFKDINNEILFICRSTVNTKESIKIDESIYPLYKMEISSYSHPFFTGEKKFLGKTGPAEKFKKKYEKYKKF
ncbi:MULTISPECIES: type B 50S ribosomal protein L31 [Blattabacterium]|uniref:50S ribosomal protein L31 n=1 Tax=Blattabacterium punctulatus TaxID=164514 RepID=A0ABN5M1M6_9FLAO|nr:MULTISPECIES: type B 50S ribosomal protein L31 [Blattabacterium]AEU09170.1 50S ribosomal protein L31 [Blattabacterium sp. (Cryptocercus punctulatus) str. Cpu]AWU39687.1 type B 50S ribosomal protein L31 [Blattabacterium punctulatus]AWU40232.1 type B 50S ribosomal protein L31 [Blattabacterium punctulatus]AWU42487.1 type B 50S ribosomal protein L31 [Blattabacterium punctulatus]AWU43029.1 type B 50S ribosomal protein L31 [Blattabacterium punctulatus]